MTRTLAFVLILFAALPLFAASDVLTVSTLSAPRGTVAVPIYVRDVSGSPLGMDQAAANRIQAFGFKVAYSPSSAVSAATFTRAGVLQGLTPLFETVLTPQGSASIGYVGSFAQSNNPVSFTLNAAAPGNLIGHLFLTVPPNVATGTVITLTVDATNAALSNQAGTTLESGNNGKLAVVNGAVTVIDGACTYALQPASATFFNTAATGTVNVTTTGGCAWTALSNTSSFLTVTGGASGVGSGAVTYAVTQNGTGLQRAGTLTVAGQTFSVTQRSFGPVRGDFNVDGKVDVLWRNTHTGENVVWHLSNNILVGGSALQSLDPAWKLLGAADFNQDGLTDLVFRYPGSGSNIVWFMNGTSYAGLANLPTVSDPNWTIEAIADFNGDTHPDIVWHNHANGMLVIWRMNGLNIMSAAEFGLVDDLNWHVVGAADFNDDGQIDLAWRHSTRGSNVFWRMNGLTLLNGVEVDALPDNNWKLAAVGDYNGDGKPDFFWHNAANGNNGIWKIVNFAFAGGLEVDGLPDLRWVGSGPR
jgi:FG-GAP-like repeat